MTQAPPPNEAVPTAICAYPIPGWRLARVEWSEIDGQPDGWIVSLVKEKPNWREDRREICAMARSDIGPLEAWDEALRIAIRSDERAAKAALDAETSDAK